MPRRLVSSLLLLALAFAPISAAAAPRDAAAKKKIDEAINTHYLTTDFDKAESVLLGTLSACEDRCSGPVRAQAWMYVGIVRGSGKGDQAGAAEAFQAALAEDPNVTLDEALATPETMTTFKGVAPAAATAPAAAPAAPSAPVASAAPAPVATGTMLCLPTVREVETRRAIPLSCETPQPAVGGVVFYKEFGGESWQQVKMEKRGTSLQGMIPCTATALAGKLQFYVEARDAAGNVVDANGSPMTPIEFSVLNATNQPPPAYPGQDAPERCAEAGDCPPDFPGCSAGAGNKEWGDSCAANDECQTGLCKDGSCDYCGSSADCRGGATCDDGFCRGGSGGGKGATGPHKKLWLGLHGAVDIGFLRGDQICMDQDWSCFYQTPPPGAGVGAEDVWYPYQPLIGYAGKVPGGVGLATIRALFSADYALTDHLLLGVRAGYAFNGGPEGNAKFLPIHGEGRATYSFVSLAKRGVRPYLHLGGGIGQVDAKIPVKIIDCTYLNAGAEGYPRLDDTGYYLCATGDIFNPSATQPTQLTVDAYKRMGQGFIAPGGGAVFAFTENMGIQLNLDVKIMLPTTGLSFSPSLGFVYGLL